MSTDGALADALQSPGPRLVAARERLGLTTARAAEQLRLDVSIVEAMEADHFEGLGAPVYARGHLRKYGALLGVPGDELVSAYDRLASGPVAPTLIPAASARGFSRPKPWLLPAAALVVALLVAVSLWWSFGGTPAAPPPGDTKIQEGPAAEAAPTSASEATSTASDEMPSAEAPSPATFPAVVDTMPAPVATAPTATTPIATAPLSNATPGNASSDAVRLEVSLSAPCWIEIYDSRGQRVAFEMAPAQAQRSFQGGPWKVLIGNAAAARLALGGRPLVLPAELTARNVAWIEVETNGAVRRADAAQPTPRSPET